MFEKVLTCLQGGGGAAGFFSFQLFLMNLVLILCYHFPKRSLTSVTCPSSSFPEVALAVPGLGADCERLQASPLPGLRATRIQGVCEE